MIKTPARYVVRKNTQLTSLQDYVYCNEEATANAVASCFNNKTREVLQYRWQSAANTKGKPHWCVVGDLKYVVARSAEVRRGQWYMGPWSRRSDAEDFWVKLLSGDADTDDFTSGDGPLVGHTCDFVIVDAEEHARLADEANREPELYRNQLRPGDCFSYVDILDMRIIVVQEGREEVPDLPDDWYYSCQTQVSTHDGKKKVKRIPKWNTDNGPIILPCVDPFRELRDAIFVRETKHVGKLTGAECLARFEMGQRTESIAWNGIGFVCTNAECGLDAAQIEHARDLWSHKLKLAAAEARVADVVAAERERNAIVCDDVDEMPNMAWVEES